MEVDSCICKSGFQASWVESWNVGPGADILLVCAGNVTSLMHLQKSRNRILDTMERAMLHFQNLRREMWQLVKSSIFGMPLESYLFQTVPWHSRHQIKCAVVECGIICTLKLHAFEQYSLNARSPLIL